MDNGQFDTLIKQDADTADTLALIVDTVNTYAHSDFVKQCAATLCPPGTDRNNCLHNVFEYYCRNVEYILDTPGIEKVYTPARTIREGYGDCKKAATFISSVLLASGIEPVLKHVYYHGNDAYTHIYVIVPVHPGDISEYITLDPTNDCEFDKEVSYNKGTLYFLDGKKMELRQMGNPKRSSAIGYNNGNDSLDSMMGAIDDLSRNTIGPAPLPSGLLPHSTKLAQSLNLSPSQAATNIIYQKFKNVPFNEQRGAFLNLIKSNTGGISQNLLALWNIDPDKVEQFWKEFGGDTDTLKQAIINGALNPVLPIGSEDDDIEESFGQQSDFAAADNTSVWQDIGNYLGKAVPIINAAANLATTIAPQSDIANTMQQMAHQANASTYTPIPGKIPVDPTGHAYPPGASAGSFGTPVGFWFKALIIVSVIANIYHPINPLFIGFLALVCIIMVSINGILKTN